MTSFRSKRSKAGSNSLGNNTCSVIKCFLTGSDAWLRGFDATAATAGTGVIVVTSAACCGRPSALREVSSLVTNARDEGKSFDDDMLATWREHGRWWSMGLALIDKIRFLFLFEAVRIKLSWKLRGNATLASCSDAPSLRGHVMLK